VNATHLVSAQRGDAVNPWSVVRVDRTVITQRRNDGVAAASGDGVPLIGAADGSRVLDD